MLALDADYVVSDELIAELEKLQPDPQTAGYRASFVYCINGKKLQSGIYPPVTVLYRREAASYIQDGHTQRVALEGPIEDLRSPMFHDDRKSLKTLVQVTDAIHRTRSAKTARSRSAELGFADRLRRWRFVVPPAMLVYCLIVRGGIFDGWAGFYYAFQRTLAELMLSVHLIARTIYADNRRCIFSASTLITATRRRRLLKMASLIAAVEEERFNRFKHSAGFPAQAIRYCLDAAGIGLEDLDHVGISRDPSAHLHKKILFAATRVASQCQARSRIDSATLRKCAT